MRVAGFSFVDLRKDDTTALAHLTIMELLYLFANSAAITHFKYKPYICESLGESKRQSEGTGYAAPAAPAFGGYSAPAAPASDFAMLDDDDAHLPF